MCRRQMLRPAAARGPAAPGAGGATAARGAGRVTGGVTARHHRCTGRVALVTDARQREQTMNRLKKRRQSKQQTNQVFAQRVLMPLVCNYL